MESDSSSTASSYALDTQPPSDAPAWTQSSETSLLSENLQVRGLNVGNVGQQKQERNKVFGVK